MNTRPRRLALLGLASGVLLALIVAPQTRWLVRLQALTSLNLYHPLPLLGMTSDVDSSYFTSEEDDSQILHRGAERHPNEYATQYAYAAKKPGAPEILTALRALALRFPEEPSLYANVLRHETRGNVTLHRVEDYLGGPLPTGYKPGPTPTPAALAAFDWEAAAGERLDPDNAYFPLMRAVGLFAAHRDAAGLAAVHRASLKRRWREYIPDDVHSQWRLHEEAFGDPGGMGRIALFGQTLLPQYQGLRAVARVTVYKAILAEKAGQVEQGLAIRRDLMRCARLMRDQSTVYIGSLVAVAMNTIARSQPGGLAGAYKYDTDLTSDQNVQKRLDLYCAYVRRLGHEDAAQEALADAAAGVKVRALQQSGGFQRITTEGARLLCWWLAGLITLANLFWLLSLGGLASGLARTRWAQEARQPGPWDWKLLLKRTAGALGLGLALALLTLLFLNAADLTQRAPDWLAYVGGLFLLVALVFGARWVFSLRLKRSSPAWRDAGKALRSALLMALFLSLVYVLARWQAGGIQSLALGWNSLVPSSGDNGAPSVSDPPAGLAASEQALLLSVAATLALPLLLLLFLAVAARIRGVPVLVGLVRGFQSIALPMACGLLLVYGGLTLVAVRQDSVVREGTERTVTGEGQYLAEQAGQPWPVMGR